MASSAEALTTAAQHLVAGSLLVSVTAQAGALLQLFMLLLPSSRSCAGTSLSAAGMASLYSLQYCPSTRNMQTQVSLVLRHSKSLRQMRLSSSSWELVLCPLPSVALPAYDGSILRSCPAGHFHRLDKAVTSLRNNAIFYLVLMVRRVLARQALPAQTRPMIATVWCRKKGQAPTVTAHLIGWAGFQSPLLA